MDCGALPRETVQNLKIMAEMKESAAAVVHVSCRVVLTGFLKHMAKTSLFCPCSAVHYRVHLQDFIHPPYYRHWNRTDPNVSCKQWFYLQDDTLLGGLIMVLSNSDSTVVHLALEVRTFQYSVCLYLYEQKQFHGTSQILILFSWI